MASLSRSGRGIEGEGWPTFEALREAAEELRAATRLNLLPTLSRLSMFDGFPGGRFALAV